MRIADFPVEIAADIEPGRWVLPTLSHSGDNPGTHIFPPNADGGQCPPTAVEVYPSALSGTRKIVDVIFSYTNRNTDVVEKFAVRVDVTEEFPFLITKLSPYFDR